jgi:hypothetical protein
LRRTTTLMERHYVRPDNTRRCYVTPQPREHLFRQCKLSPPLQSPQKTPTPAEINKMIEMYESQLPEYDAVVQSFCDSPDN